jgi:enoyl-[acyl-carrier protein] reductase I
VEPLALGLEAEIVAALDVSKPGELEALFETIRENWGRLDLLVYSIAR